MTALLFDEPASAGKQFDSVDCMLQISAADGLICHLHRTRGFAESNISYRRRPQDFKLTPRRVRFAGGRAFLPLLTLAVSVDDWRPAHPLDLPTVTPAMVRDGQHSFEFGEHEFTPEMLQTRHQALKRVAAKNAKILRRLAPGDAMRYHDGWWSVVEFGEQLCGTWLSVDMSPCGVGRLCFDRTLACRVVRPTAAELRALEQTP